MNFEWTCFVIHFILLFDVSLPLVVSRFDGLEEYYLLRKKYEKENKEFTDPVLQFTDEQKEKLCNEVLENWYFDSIIHSKYVNKNDYDTFKEIKSLSDETYFEMHYEKVKKYSMSKLNIVSGSDTDEGYTATSEGTIGDSDTEGSSVTSGKNKTYTDSNDKKLGKRFNKGSPSSAGKKFFKKLALRRRNYSAIDGISNKEDLNVNAQGRISSDDSGTDSDPLTDDSMVLIVKDTNYITDSDGRQYKAVYSYKSFLVQITNGPGISQLVFPCLAKKKFTNNFVDYYISYGYVENELFLYEMHTSSNYLMLLALIEPSPSATDFKGNQQKLEEYYLEQIKIAAQDILLKQSGDQVCGVTDLEKNRICSLVFSSDRYGNSWQFTNPVNAVRRKCETQQIFFDKVGTGKSKLFADMLECKVKRLGSISVYKSFYVSQDPADKTSVFVFKSDSKYRTLDAHIKNLSVLIERYHKSYTIPLHYGAVSVGGGQDNSLLGSLFDFAKTFKNSIL